MVIESHFDLSDNQFESEFASGSLRPELFTHEAHLRLAWIHIKKYGLDAACENMRDQIKHFVANLGLEDKYHETVTMASTQAVHHFVQRSKAKSFKDFLTEFPRLKNNFKDLLAQHYSADIFHSETARTTYIEPDLEQF